MDINELKQRLQKAGVEYQTITNTKGDEIGIQFQLDPPLCWFYDEEARFAVIKVLYGYVFIDVFSHVIRRYETTLDDIVKWLPAQIA